MNVKNAIIKKWYYGLFLILLFGIGRFLLVLNANVTGQYGKVSILFGVMMLLPFLFIDKKGRFQIKIKWPKTFSSLIWAFIAGCIASYILFIIGWWLYEDSYYNWYVYISKSIIPASIDPSIPKSTLFLIVASMSMLFSPIGEELFYRGMVHYSLAGKFGSLKASVFDALAFAVTHLAHFGIVYHQSEWHFLLVPSVLWVILIFFSGLLFTFWRHYTDSILGSIICHSGFNFGMVYSIMYLLE